MREAGKLKQAKWLAQGTIYPDVIESGGAANSKGAKKAITIKSHHNVGGLPATLGLKLLEPLRELFKDEVRELGVALGLPHEMVYRHPFPGPGLGVRILGEVKREFADLLRGADAIFIAVLRPTIDPASGKSWYALTSQALAACLPGKRGGRRPRSASAVDRSPFTPSAHCWTAVVSTSSPSILLSDAATSSRPASDGAPFRSLTRPCGSSMPPRFRGPTSTPPPRVSRAVGRPEDAGVPLWHGSHRRLLLQA